jgi:glycerophosphoryl diester phosphodiesterase
VASPSTETRQEFTVIAHRGASGYLPEHTLEGAAMAHAMGADYIELDVVLTRDDALIVLHDLFLDAVTDVAERYPGRARADGRHYAIDFSLEEIRRLRVHERTDPNGAPVLPGRFPLESAIFHVPTLEEEILLIQGLNRSTGRNVGWYIESKAPAWHRAEGKDLMAAVLGLLATQGLAHRDDKVLLQSFDFDALVRARNDLGSELRLVQLIGENDWRESPSDFEFLQTEAGLRAVAGFAQGIGPWLPQVIEIKENGLVDISELAALAQRLGLFVHAYTLRADQLPPGIGGMREAVRLLVEEARLDGVFTDHPDQVIDYLRSRC